MIYYSHVNEDNRAERMALGEECYHRLLCVAGSGERVIALLDAPGLEAVDVIDINPEALYLLKIKLAALELLDIKNYLGFIGFFPMTTTDRKQCFRTCKKLLEEEVYRYWKNRSDWQRSGFLYTGHFEKFLARVRPVINIFLGKGIENAFRKDISAFPSYRWKWLKRFFAKKWMFRLFGNRDIAFTGQGCNLNRIGEGIDHLLTTKKLDESFMAHLIFKGHLRDMQPAHLPPSLQLSVLMRVQDRLRSHALTINYYNDDFLSHFKHFAKSYNGTRVFCSLSDLLSFERPDYFLKLLSEVDTIPPEKKSFVIRSFLRNDLQPTDFQNIIKQKFKIQDISSFDKTAMYKVFKIEKHYDKL